MANKCKDCGCTCKRCMSSDHDVQLHVEIENLKQRLFEKESHIVQMETNFLNETNKYPSGEVVAIREELLTWQDKYKRLYEAHRRVQRVNQGLEDKLLKLVDVSETDKSTLTKDIATLSHKLAEANYTIKKLTEDNERYKNDVSLAIQFLQCKQSNFVAHRFDTLPPEVQSQVSNHMSTKKKIEEKKTTPDVKNIKVPIPTFPPTAMVYSIPKTSNSEKKAEPDIEAPPPVDVVSAAIMAKVLEERQKERSMVKHCDTCTCAKNLKIVYDSSHHSIGTQTGEYKAMLCIRCNDNVKTITDSSMKVVRTSESKTPKVIPVYPLEAIDIPASTQTYNVVKVQPNNFLIDNKLQTLSNSNSSSLLDVNKSNYSPKNKLINPNNHVINNEINTFQDISFVRSNEMLSKTSAAPLNASKSDTEKAESETNIDVTSTKNIVSDKSRASRHHPASTTPSRGGTRNILLDNAQNIAPLVLTKATKTRENIVRTEENTETSSENMLRLSSMASETTAQNQQRVAEWIQNNLEEDISSSDNSRSDPIRTNSDQLLDKVKYAEMEENVKRFLFGEKSCS